jgi:hypothetical protein
MERVEAPVFVEDQTGVGNAELMVNLGSWFQRGASELASLLDRGIAVPINTLLERIRESDGLDYDDEGE